MASKLTLYQHAALLLKQQWIAALTDSDEMRQALDIVYDDALAYMLQQGAWKFANRSVAIQASTTVVPSFGYAQAFVKPSDYVRTIFIAGNGDFNPLLNAYDHDNSYWYADVGVLYVQYVSNGNAYGLNLGVWPATYTLAVEHELAYRVAPHITTMDAGALKDFERRKNNAMRDARSKDAMEQPARYQPMGRLVRARGRLLAEDQRRQNN